MMNKSITILKYKGLHPHQTFIESIPLMKRESRADRPCPTPRMMNFSFGECFDETMMRTHNTISQYVIMPIHQIIVFSFIIKSVEI